MEIAFTGGAIPAEAYSHFIFIADLGCQCQSVCDRHSSCQMGDHAKDVVLWQAKMKGSVSSSGKSVSFAEELTEEWIEGDITGGEYAQVPVHGQNMIIRL